MAAWKVVKDTSVERFWRKLETREPVVQSAFAEALRVLSETPYVIENDPSVVKHLKGNHKCNHEYRRLPNAQRVYYKILTREEIEKEAKAKNLTIEWDDENQRGQVFLYYAGPHP